MVKTLYDVARENIAAMPVVRIDKKTRVYFVKQKACAKAYLSGNLNIFARLPLPTRFLYFKNNWGLDGYALEKGGMLSDAAYDMICYNIPAGPADAQGRHTGWANHVRDVIATWPGVCIYEVFTTPRRTSLAAVVVLVKYASRRTVGDPPLLTLHRNAPSSTAGTHARTAGRSWPQSRSARCVQT
jgi:hypothetical protein